MENLPLTINEVQKDLIDGKYTVADIVEIYLKQIHKYNKEFNIFITVTEEEARKKAAESDKLLKEFGVSIFKKYPLLGVCVSYKDIYLTKGIRTTAASKVLDNYIPQYSATVVEKLEDAGAIIVGKTNCDAWAHGSSGENSDYGPTRNPWNEKYVPGGSSSGSAVSVATDMSLAAMGSDT